MKRRTNLVMLALGIVALCVVGALTPKSKPQIPNGSLQSIDSTFSNDVQRLAEQAGAINDSVRTNRPR